MRVRAGFTPQEDVQKYSAPNRASSQRSAASAAPVSSSAATPVTVSAVAGSRIIPGASNLAPVVNIGGSTVGLSKNQKRNQRKALKKILASDSEVLDSANLETANSAQVPKENTTKSKDVLSPSEDVAPKSTSDDVEKKIKSGRKKLRQICLLEGKDPAELSPQEMQKLEKKGELEREIATLLEKMNI